MVIVGNTVRIPRFNTRPIALSFGDGGGLPSEFRLFVRGWNETENGRYLFDDEAAAAVMAAYREWGVDLAIDLEHQMLGDAGTDPTARDARGWCKLELRADGSLWAVDVKWTPDGAARLSEKRQRYVSPAFQIDPETKRVEKVLNVAITAMPATHQTPALVAASVGGCMDPKQVAAALDALIAGDSDKCADLLKGIIAQAAGAPAEPAPPADPPAEMEAAAAPPAADPEAPPAEDDEEEEKATVAASARLVRLSGKATAAEAVEEIEAWRASHLALQAELKKLAAERADLESAERRRLCGDLVRLGAEFPSTVWADGNAVALKPRWSNMPIAELRTHVAEQRAARGGKAPSAPKTPAGGKQPAATGGDQVITTSLGPVTLSASEIAAAKEAGAQLDVFATNKAIRDAQRARAGK